MDHRIPREPPGSNRLKGVRFRADLCSPVPYPNIRSKASGWCIFRRWYLPAVLDATRTKGLLAKNAAKLNAKGESRMALEPSSDISRRRFLTASGLTVAAACFAPNHLKAQTPGIVV